MEHELKTWPSSFVAIWQGEKRYELRRADRDFQVGHTLLLREWVPEHAELGVGGCGDVVLPDYTGRWIRARVTCVTRSGEFPGLEPGFVIMGITAVDASAGGPAR